MIYICHIKHKENVWESELIVSDDELDPMRQVRALPREHVTLVWGAGKSDREQHKCWHKLLGNARYCRIGEFSEMPVRWQGFAWQSGASHTGVAAPFRISVATTAGTTCLSGSGTLGTTQASTCQLSAERLECIALELRCRQQCIQILKLADSGKLATIDRLDSVYCMHLVIRALTVRRTARPIVGVFLLSLCSAQQLWECRVFQSELVANPVSVGLCFVSLPPVLSFDTLAL